MKNRDKATTTISVNHTGQAQITIPASIRRAKGWKHKDKLSWNISEMGIITLKKEE